MITIAHPEQSSGELIKNDSCFLLTIARSNGVTIKDLNRLKTNTLVSSTVSSGTGLGIDYLTV